MFQAPPQPQPMFPPQPAMAMPPQQQPRTTFVSQPTSSINNQQQPPTFQAPPPPGPSRYNNQSRDNHNQFSHNNLDTTNQRHNNRDFGGNNQDATNQRHNNRDVGGNNQRHSREFGGGGGAAAAGPSSGGGRSFGSRPSTVSTSRPGSSRESSIARSGGDMDHMDDFGDMGAAAKSYVSSATKGPAIPTADIPGVTCPSKEDLNPYRTQHGLLVWDASDPDAPVPDPYERFEDFRGMSPQMLQSFRSAGFQAPTPIQAQTWPIAIGDRDVVSIAKTGSGKTLAFLLPAYKKMDAMGGGRQRGIQILVLAPTRELATQIQDEAGKFGGAAGYHSACAYGGAPKRDQLREIQSGASILVATPGRLNDFLDSNQVDLSQVFYLVLDEADRMLDMGFEPQIREILKRLPRRRQTLMFSATWPEEVRQLASDFSTRPIHIQLGHPDEGLQANTDIKQHLILLQSGEDKDKELVNLPRSKIRSPQDLVLIFVARKNTCDFVSNALNRVGIRAAAMHSDRDQKHREATLAAFKEGHTPVMVATDVASRGLDVRGICAVVNYDLANTTEDYVHRIGRTGG